MSTEYEFVPTEHTDRVPQISNCLSSNLSKQDLDEEHLHYLSCMILEDPPRNPKDLEELIKDFVQNGQSHMTRSELSEMSSAIFDQLKQHKLIESQQRSVWSAERLEKEVVMEKVQLISEREYDAGYTETPFSFEVLKFSNQLIEQDEEALEKERAKKEEKERKRKEVMLKRHREEMKKMEHRLPEVQVKHNVDGNYSKNIKVDSFLLEIGGKILLEDAKLILSTGHRYGLIGKNGIGKTTLLYAIARKEIEDMNADPQILMIEQEVQGSDKTALEIVLETDGERKQLLEEEELLLKDPNADSKRLEKIYERLEEIDASKAESKALTLLYGLGFTEKYIKLPSRLLSGGWRMRVALAKVLFCDPDILLLDEPTNHLDLDAVLWLEDYLQKFQNTVFVVSHAREFLNSVCTDIIDLKNQKLTYYRGNYDDYEKQKDATILRQQKEFEAQQRQISHVQSFIERFRFNAKKASLVQSRLKHLERIKRVETVLQEDPNYHFEFSPPDQVRPPIIRVDDGVFGYSPEDVLLKDLNFSVDMDSKIALLGANGVGKTTFLKILTSKLELQRGQVYHNRKAKVAMFSQHHVEKLDLARSPVDQFTALYPDVSNEKIRKHLAKFGIFGNTALRPCYLLSGGQKSRVSLGLAAWGNPHVIIFDEPTNHLDMQAVDALVLALNAFEGGVIVVSHDQYFVSCVCNEIWYIKNLQLKKFNGDFENYRNALATNSL